MSSEENKSASDTLDTGLFTPSEENLKVVKFFTDLAREHHSDILNDDQIVGICVQENFVSAKIESYIAQYVRQVRDLEAINAEQSDRLAADSNDRVAS